MRPNAGSRALLAATLLAIVFTTPFERSGVAAPAQTLRVAAASDLQSVFPALASRFEQTSGHRLTITFGSSGNFFSQIQNGAPFDVYFAADIDYPRRLVAAGLAEGPPTRYAIGRIVLWAPEGTNVDLRQGLQALRDSRIEHIAIANPDHAPYGRAAVASLRHEGLYDELKGKLVLGESVSQAAQFARSASADVAIIALSLARAPALASGRSYEIPASLHPPIEQGAVVLASSPNKSIARDLLAFVQQPETVRLLQRFGFVRPGNR